MNSEAHLSNCLKLGKRDPQVSEIHREWIDQRRGPARPCKGARCSHSDKIRNQDEMLRENGLPKHEFQAWYLYMQRIIFHDAAQIRLSWLLARIPSRSTNWKPQLPLPPIKQDVTALRRRSWPTHFRGARTHKTGTKYFHPFSDVSTWLFQTRIRKHPRCRFFPPLTKWSSRTRTQTYLETQDKQLATEVSKTSTVV